MRIGLGVLTTGLVAAALLTSCSDDGTELAAPTVPSPTLVAANATVEFVVDGDTIDVMIDGSEERVRLIGIDTPEIEHAASGDRPGNPADCFGPEASAYTQSLLPEGTPVRIERDVVPRDDYGRLLAYVFRADDGVLINYELARQGYAQPLTIPPNVAYSQQFVDAASQAQTDDVGLWSAC